MNKSSDTVRRVIGFLNNIIEPETMKKVREILSASSNDVDPSGNTHKGFIGVEPVEGDERADKFLKSKLSAEDWKAYDNMRRARDAKRLAGDSRVVAMDSARRVRAAADFARRYPHASTIHNS